MIGIAEIGKQKMRILDRIVTWTREGAQHKRNERHVEIATRELGLSDDARELRVPTAKDDYDGGSEKELDRSPARQYRGAVA